MLKILLVVLIPGCLGIIVTDKPPCDTDYRYAYDIEDPITGDLKSQREVREGDVVRGSYTVLGPDGTKRTVEYTADPKHGFKAILKEQPVTENLHPLTAPKIRRVKPVKQYYVKEAPRTIYFTPKNEISNEKLSFDHGRYFIPADE